jgi:hypothetical protein
MLLLFGLGEVDQLHMTGEEIPYPVNEVWSALCMVYSQCQNS